MPTKTDICNLAISLIGEELSTLSDVDTDDNKVSRQCLLHYDQTLEEVTRMHTWNCARKRTKLCVEEVEEYPLTITVSDGKTLTFTSLDGNDYPQYEDDIGLWQIIYNASIGAWKYNTSNASASEWISTETTDKIVPKCEWGAGDGGEDPISLEYDLNYGWSNKATVPADSLRLIALDNNDSYYRYLQFNTDWTVEGRTVLSNNGTNFLLYEAIPTLANMDSLFLRAFYTQLAIKLVIPLSGDRAVRQELINEMEALIMPEARRVNGFEGYERPVQDSEWLEATLIPTTGGSTTWQALSVGDIPMN